VTPGRCLLVAGLTAFALTATACDRDGGEADGEAQRADVTVFAAASLTEAFTAIGDAFMAAHPDTSVTFNFAASSELATQVVNGAPVDVYVSADLAAMARLTDAGLAAEDPVVFTTNRAEIIVEPGNPLGLTGIEDLAAADLVLVTCAPTVPCGIYATQIFDNAGVDVTPDSFEQNVKAVVTKVTLGEADAGIAYATDVLAAGDDADGVEIPDDLNVTAEYPIVTTTSASNPDGAAAFVDFVLGPAGQDILRSLGFTPP
jgi:molybdate transport system substrate-binding protein